jgi:hypothetical protein
VKLSRVVLLRDIFDAPQPFFELIDLIDQNEDGGHEVREAAYLELYQKRIARDPSSAAARHLDLSTMLENGLFIYNDRTTGRIAVDDALVNILRFADIDRARNLTNADFEQFRQEISTSVNRVLGLECEDDGYNESIATFNATLFRCLSKLKENVLALNRQGLAVASKYEAYWEGGTDIEVGELFRAVESLHINFVRPCHEFIDPVMRIKGGQSFSESLEQLAEYHENALNAPAIACHIRMRKSAVTSYYKDIAELERRLSIYCSHLQEDVRHKVALDRRWADIVASVEEKQHGQLKNMYLDSRSKAFQSASVLDGLEVHNTKFPAKLNWNRDALPLRLIEYQYFLEDKSEKESRPLKRLPENLKLEDQRKIQVSKILLAKPLPPSRDLHQDVNKILSGALCDNTLLDALYGVEALLPMVKLQRQPVGTRKIKRIEDDNFFLDYLPLSTTETLANV